MTPTSIRFTYRMRGQKMELSFPYTFRDNGYPDLILILTIWSKMQS